MLARHADDPTALRDLARLLEAGGQDAEARTVTARARAPTPTTPRSSCSRHASRRSSAIAPRPTPATASYVARHPATSTAGSRGRATRSNAGEPDRAVAEYRAVDRRAWPDRASRRAGARAARRRTLRGGRGGRARRGRVRRGRAGGTARARAERLSAGPPARRGPLYEDAADSAARHPVDATYRPGSRWRAIATSTPTACSATSSRAGRRPSRRPASSPADLWLLRGDVARKRGDFRRAREDYERAAELGAPLRAGVALERLDGATRPSGGVGYAFFADANRLEVNGGALWARAAAGRRGARSPSRRWCRS